MSWQMKAIAIYLRLSRKRRYATAAAGASRLAQPKGPSAPPAELARHYDVTREAVETFDVYTVRPHGAPTSTQPRGTVIYLHGGSYVNEIDSKHWELIADLADTVGCQVMVPIYGLAPKHHVEEALTLMHAVLTTATAAGATYLVGDSAGGGLALAATLQWLGSGGTPPQGLTLIAPWLDISLTNPAIADIEASDPWLSRAGIRVCGQSWSGPVEPGDPRVSPLYGDFTDTPLIDLYVGDRDITVADCRLLRDRLPADRIRYHEQRGAVHVYPLLPAPEGRAARRELIAHINAALNL
ncbi:MAG: esterase [Mycobacterium sp.]|nr:esterase [Mycobacterium sp.]